MRPRTRMVAAVTFALLAVAMPRPGGAQSTVIFASVRDSFGAPVHPSRIDVKGTTIFALGDRLGQVVLPAVPLGRHTLRVRGIGFWEREVEVEARLDTLRLATLVLRRNPILDSLNIVAPKR